jgi:aminoglycoside N3'-acetyltransferase/acyl carrier protein
MDELEEVGKIITEIVEEKTGYDIGNEKNDINLVQKGILTSIGFMEFILSVEDQFSVEMDLADKHPREFTSVSGLAKLICSAQANRDSATKSGFYSKSDITEVIQKSGLTSGDTVFVHSALVSLGSFSGGGFAELTGIFFDEIINIIGQNGTLVVPTFTLSFCDGNIFDQENTASENMGEFSEYVRMRSNAFRTLHPMQSVAAVGKYAEELSNKDTESAFDIGGPFDFMINLDSKVMLLGASIRYNSCIHYSEQHANVPYRYFKNFTGECIVNGQREKKTYKMHVRQLDPKPFFDQTIITNNELMKNYVISNQIGAGRIKTFPMGKFVCAASTILKGNPYAIVIYDKSKLDSIYR